MKINDAIFGAILLVVGAIVLVHVQGFPTIPGQQYGPGLFPGVIAVGFLVCGALLVFGGIRKRAGAPWVEVPGWMGSRRHLFAFLAVVLGLVAYIYLAEPIGFLIVAPVLLVIWFRVLDVKWSVSIVAAVIATLLIWFAFYKLLRVPLPWGLLTPYAF